MRRALGWSSLVLLLLAILAVVFALTFSVQVRGSSMRPTLTDGDRVMLEFWKQGKAERFDVVDAELGPSGVKAVKRVVGLPGDIVSVRIEDDAPVVTITPAGSSTSYVVQNAAWSTTATAKLEPCCGPEGTRSSETTEVVVPDESYWLLGDNWGGSDDSRTFGFVKADRIHGHLSFRVLPLGSFGKVTRDVRLVRADG